MNEPDITVPVKVRIRGAFVPNEPDISFLLALSVARLELVATNEPDITAPVNDLINAALAPNEPETDAAVIPPNEPEIVSELSDLIKAALGPKEPEIDPDSCTDEDINVLVFKEFIEVSCDALAAVKVAIGVAKEADCANLTQLPPCA